MGVEASAVLRRLAPAAAVVALLAPQAAAPASADPVTLSIEGTPNASSSYFLSEQVSLEGALPGFYGGGSYLGAVIERTTPTHQVVVVALRAKALGDVPLVQYVDTTLEPGRYTVHLFSDRSRSRVAFTMAGLSGMRLETRTRQPVRVTTGTAPLGTGVSDVELRLPGGVAVGRSALLAHRVQGERVEQTYSCVTFQSGCPPEPVVVPLAEARVDSPVTVPSAVDDAALEHATRSGEARQALVGVDGARLKSDALRGVLLVYGR